QRLPGLCRLQMCLKGLKRTLCSILLQFIANVLQISVNFGWTDVFCYLRRKPFQPIRSVGVTQISQGIKDAPSVRKEPLGIAGIAKCSAIRKLCPSERRLTRCRAGQRLLRVNYTGTGGIQRV